MTNKNRMLQGKLYCADDQDLSYEFKTCKGILEEFNSTSFRDGKRRGYLIKQVFKKTGIDLHIEPPFYCDYGYNISIGQNFYASYDCILADSGEITIGNSCILGSRVLINTLDFPVDASVRNDDLECAKPVHIGDDVYIGSGAIINPGVTIGDDIIVCFGSVVFKDLASHGVYAGNPAVKIRNITDAERKKWKEKQTEYYKDADVSQQES